MKYILTADYEAWRANRAETAAALERSNQKRDAKLDLMPNKPKTPLRSIRISDDVWVAAQEKAAAEGRTVSEVVREALERYAKRKAK